MTLKTHHILVAVQAPERLGRNSVGLWLGRTIARGMSGVTAQELAEACGVDARELVDNTDLYEMMTEVITDKRPPLPAPVAALFRAARAACADPAFDIDTVTFSIDGRVFFYDSWNFGGVDISDPRNFLSNAMEEAVAFVSASYPLPATFEWPDDLLDDVQKDSLAQLMAALQSSIRDGSLKKMADKLGEPFTDAVAQKTLADIDKFLKEQS